MEYETSETTNYDVIVFFINKKNVILYSNTTLLNIMHTNKRMSGRTLQKSMRRSEDV